MFIALLIPVLSAFSADSCSDKIQNDTAKIKCLVTGDYAQGAEGFVKTITSNIRKGFSGRVVYADTSILESKIIVNLQKRTTGSGHFTLRAYVGAANEMAPTEFYNFDQQDFADSDVCQFSFSNSLKLDGSVLALCTVY